MYTKFKHCTLISPIYLCEKFELVIYHHLPTAYIRGIPLWFPPPFWCGPPTRDYSHSHGCYIYGPRFPSHKNFRLQTHRFERFNKALHKFFYLWTGGRDGVFWATIYTTVASDTGFKVEGFVFNVNGICRTITDTSLALDAGIRNFFAPPF